MKFAEIISYLFEDEAPPRTIVASPRFEQEYPKFVRKYPHFKSNLRGFLLFRQSARPGQPFNAKDGILTGPLQGLRRVHLVHGKALVIYTTNPARVQLITVDEHTALEGKRINALATYARTLSPSDYNLFSIPDDEEPPKSKQKRLLFEPLSQHDVDQVKSLFLYFVRDHQGRPILQQAAVGNIEPFMEWARMTVGVDDTSRDQAILHALDGREVMIKRAKRWIEMTSKDYQAPEPAAEPVQGPVQIPASPEPSQSAAAPVATSEPHQQAEIPPSIRDGGLISKKVRRPRQQPAVTKAPAKNPPPMKAASPKMVKKTPAKKPVAKKAKAEKPIKWWK